MRISGRGNSWRIYQLQNLAFNEKISLIKPQGDSSSVTTIECQTSRVKGNSKSGQGLNENLADIKLEVTNCSPETGRRECNVTISSSNKLEWTNGFKPRVGFCDPSHHSKP